MEMGCFVCAILGMRMPELVMKGYMSFIGSGSCDMSECHWVYFTKMEEGQLAMSLQLTPVQSRSISG